MFPSSWELSLDMLAPFTYASMMNFRTAGLQWHSDICVRTLEMKREPRRGHTTTTTGLVEILDLLPTGFVLHDAAVLPQHTKIEPVGNEREHYGRRF